MNLIVLLLVFGLASADFPNSKGYVLKEFKNGSMVTFNFKLYGDPDVHVDFYPVEQVQDRFQADIVAHVRLNLARHPKVAVNNYNKGWKTYHDAALPSEPRMTNLDIYKMSRNALLVAVNGFYAGHWNFADTDTAKSVYISSNLPGVIEWSNPEPSVDIQQPNVIIAPLTVDDFSKYRDDTSERVIMTLNKGLPIGASINISAMMKPSNNNGKFRFNVGFHSKTNPAFYPIVVGQKLDGDNRSPDLYLHTVLGVTSLNSTQCSGGVRDLEHICLERISAEQISMTLLYPDSADDTRCVFETPFLKHFDNPLDFFVSGGTMILNVDHSLGQDDVSYN